MACAGVTSYERFNKNEMPKENKNDPVRRLINMGLDMIDYTQQFTYGNGEKILLKIGIHFGGIILAVIGGHKPQLSILGETVSTANLVCSTSLHEKITLSYAA